MHGIIQPPAHRIIHGDMREILKTCPDNFFDCAIVDPPYGQTSLPWDKPIHNWQSAVHRVLKPTGSMWVFGSLRHFMTYAEDFVGWKMSHDVVWEKHNGAGFFNDRFRTVHELAAHFYRDDAKWRDVYKNPQFTMDATARTVRMKAKPAHWTGARGARVYKSEDGGPRLQRSVFFERSMHGYAEHPTQKPEGAIERLLRYACPPYGLVLDPFCGSGAVGKVAKQLGCHFVGIEADAEYVQIAVRNCAQTPLDPK